MSVKDGDGDGDGDDEGTDASRDDPKSAAGFANKGKTPSFSLSVPSQAQSVGRQRAVPGMEMSMLILCCNELLSRYWLLLGMGRSPVEPEVE